MFCDAKCGRRAVLWLGCYNPDCSSVHYFHLCLEDAALCTHCSLCGGLLDHGMLPVAAQLAPLGGGSPGDQPRPDEPRLRSLNDLILGCSASNVVHTPEMSVMVNIGHGDQAQNVILGHSFHALRAAEMALRKQCSISVSGSSASGMNIALMELRLLLVDKECNVYQIAVQLCDTFSRNLVFCSTGGIVLTETSEIARLQNLQQKTAATAEEVLVLTELLARQAGGDKLVRCCATPQPYGGSHLFALCGAYSFFDPGGQTGNDLKNAAALYKQTHDGTYRQLVNGSNHDQLFHHSEQTGFKALYQNPDLLVKVLKQAFQSGFLPDIRLSLEAVAIDVFTTRSVCRGCMNCSVCVLSSNHFFQNWLSEVENEFGGDVLIDNTRKLLRFDCAVMFKDGLLKPVLPQGCAILHGIPRPEQGAVPVTHGAFATCRLQLICNTNDNVLLDSGSQKHFMPKILGIMRQEFQLTKLPDSLSEAAKLFRALMEKHRGDLQSGVVAASALINKLCTGNNANAIVMHLNFIAQDIGMPVDAELLKLAAKFYNFLRLFEEMGVQQMPTDIYVLGLVGCGSIYFGAPEFGRTFLKAFDLAYHHAFGNRPGNNILGQVYTQTRQFILVVISELMKADDSTAESAARLLALHYDVLDDYKKLLE